MKINLSQTIFLFILLSFFSCDQERTDKAKEHPAKAQPMELEGEIRISGAYALAPFIGVCAQNFHRKHPAVNIIVVPRGSELGLDDLHRQKVDLAMVSSLTKPSQKDVQAFTVARSTIVLVFNKRNPLREKINTRGLTITDLQKIYSVGKISYWNEVLGFPDSIELHPYSRGDLAGATEALAGFLYLDRNEIVGIPVDGEEDMINILQRDSLSLGYCNMNAIFDINTYEIKEDLELLPVDLNQNGSLEPREELCGELFDFSREDCRNAYPYLLTRNLYLVGERPLQSDLTSTFIKYVLSAGRRFSDSLGYPPVPAEVIEYEIHRMKGN